jgi:CheY-like chemotaxis protein
VVDDEAAILTITSETLLAFGYKVLTAINGMDAVRLYEARRDEIAVVLTDMMMPVMDGLATIAALTRINPAVKIIAASSFTASSMGTKLEGEGVKHFLTKPYTARTLVKVVRMVIEESRVAPV